MSRKPASDNARARFARCLEGHRQAGTRPGKLEGEPWTYAELSTKIQSPRIKDDFSSPRSIPNWCKGKSLPSEIEPILDVFFGKKILDKEQARYRERLKKYYLSAKKEKSSVIISKSRRDPFGGSWVIENEQFVLDRSVRNTDRRAASDPLRLQLQRSIGKIAESLSSVSIRISNMPIWSDLFVISSRLNEILKADPNDVCANLGELYALFLAAGQYLDTDNRIMKDMLASEMPLDPQIHRLLSNLVSLSAPWLRGFPTIVTWDNEASRALVRQEYFQPTQDFNRIAHVQKAISDRDASEINILVNAGNEESVQGRKAGARAVGDIQNLIIANAEAVIKSAPDPAHHPLHVQRAISTLKSGKSQVEKVAEKLQPDLRYALLELVSELTNNDKEDSLLKAQNKKIPMLPRHILDRIGHQLASMYESILSSTQLPGIQKLDKL